MSSENVLHDFMKDIDGEYSEAQFLALACGLLASRSGDEEARKIARAMVRAAFQVCRDGDPLGYFEFIAFDILEAGTAEFDRVRGWPKRAMTRPA